MSDRIGVSNNGWMAWTLGALLLVAMASGGAVYTSLDSRVASNEKAVKESATVAVDIAVLQTKMDDTKKAVERVEALSNQNAAQNREIIAQMKEINRQYEELLREIKFRGIR